MAAKELSWCSDPAQGVSSSVAVHGHKGHCCQVKDGLVGSCHSLLHVFALILVWYLFIHSKFGEVVVADQETSTTFHQKMM